MKTFLILFLLFFFQNEKIQKKCVIIKNNYSCLDCFYSLKNQLEQNNFSNYEILIFNTSDFFYNYQSKKLMEKIYPNKIINTTKDTSLKYLKTPHLLFIENTQNKNDTQIIEYTRLFKNKEINIDLLNSLLK